MLPSARDPNEPAPHGARRAWTLVAALAIGLAVGLGVGAVVFGSDDGGGGGGSGGARVTGSTRKIALPAQLGEFRDVVDVISAKQGGSPAVKSQSDHQQKTRDMTVAAYSKAYGGAAAAYRAYSDETLERQPYVIAVRAASPELTAGPVIDPAYLRLAKPEREVQTLGEVSCLVNWTPPVLLGHTPPADSELVSNCERSSAGITVFTGGNGFKGPAGLRALVDLTNAAWTAAARS